MIPPGARTGPGEFRRYLVCAHCQHTPSAQQLGHAVDMGHGAFDGYLTVPDGWWVRHPRKGLLKRKVVDVRWPLYCTRACAESAAAVGSLRPTPSSGTLGS